MAYIPTKKKIKSSEMHPKTEANERKDFFSRKKSQELIAGGWNSREGWQKIEYLIRGGGVESLHLNIFSFQHE